MAALQNLSTPVEGVIKTYNKPFSASNHEMITPKDVVFGMVQNGRVVYLNPEDAAGPK